MQISIKAMAATTQQLAKSSTPLSQQKPPQEQEASLKRSQALKVLWEGVPRPGSNSPLSPSKALLFPLETRVPSLLQEKLVLHSGNCSKAAPASDHLSPPAPSPQYP